MNNERFVRWQSHTMAQLSIAISLLSGLSIGGLAFLFSFLRDGYFAPKGCYAVAFLGALFAFLVASSVSVAAVITRLLDFRLTAQKVRKGETEDLLTFFGTDASGYGTATWRLFWVLIVSFSIAVVLSTIVISHVYLKRILDGAGL